MTVLQQAYAVREAMDAAGAVLTENQALMCARLYKPWEVGKRYKKDEYLTYGTNGVGDPQLYRAIKDHTSQANWQPDKIASLYIPIGLDKNGYPVWAQPTGAHDAYNVGDIVDYNGVLYKSTIDGNVYSPVAYPAGWEVFE
jgi:hypothetical protein